MAAKKEDTSYLNKDLADKPAYMPDADEEKTLSFVEGRIRKMIMAKEALHLHQTWDKAEKQVSTDEAVRSSELNIKNPSKVKNNLTRTATFSILALAAARNSETQLIAEDEQDKSITPVLQAISTFIDEKSQKPVIELRNIYTTITLGTGIRKRIYRSDTRKIKEITSYDPATDKAEFKETEIQDYDDADLQDIDPRMFLIDEAATCDADARDCAERKIIQYDDFLDYYPVAKYPNAETVLPGGWIKSEKDQGRTQKVFAEVGNDEVEVIEYWNKIKDLRLIIANGVLLTPWNNPIPYRHKELPYIRSIFQIKDGQHYWGIGLPELLEHDQVLLDTLYNMMTDWMKLSINKPCLRGSSETGDDTLELEAGAMFDVNDVNQYKFLDIPPIDQTFFAALQKIEANAYKKVGIDDPMYGVKTGGTATETAIAAQSARDRLGLFFKSLEEETDVRDERLKLSIIQQMYSQPKIEEIAGEDGSVAYEEVYRKLPINIQQQSNEFGDTEVKPKDGAYFEVKPETIGVSEDRFANFIVRVKSRASVPISKELMQKRWDDLLTVVSKTPLTDLVDWAEIGKETFEKRDYNGEKFIKQQASAMDDMNELAIQENEKMMAGAQIPPTQGATPEHNDRHHALVSSADFDQLDPEIKQAILDHYQGEVAELQKVDAEGTLNEAKMMNSGQMPAGANVPMGGQMPPQNMPMQK